MRNLTAQERTNVCGGVCKYDYNTEKALKVVSSAAAAHGYAGSEAHQNAVAEVIMRATRINCDS
jgi:hypothetical protein